MATAPQTSEISVTLRLSEQTRTKLAERAASSGQDIGTIASDLIEQAVTRPTLDELLAPVRKDFAASGMSAEEVTELGRRELDALRSERRARQQ